MYRHANGNGKPDAGSDRLLANHEAMVATFQVIAAAASAVAVVMTGQVQASRVRMAIEELSKTTDRLGRLREFLSAEASSDPGQ